MSSSPPSAHSLLRTSNPPSPPPPSTTPWSQFRLLILEPSLPPLTAHCATSKQPSQSEPTVSALPQPHQQSLVPPLLKILTDHAPPFGDTERRSLAGYTTHPPLRVHTKYFDRRVGIWCDEIPFPARKRRTSGDGTGVEGQRGGELAKWKEGVEGGHAANSMATGVEEEIADGDPHVPSGTKEATNEAEDPTTRIWLTQMLSDEASEVRSAIGAIILTVPIELTVEPIDSPSSLMNTFQAHKDKSDDDDTGTTQSRGRHKFKDEYLDIISAVNTLRSTIDEERAEGAGENVGAILVLQGSIPESQIVTEKATIMSLHGEPEMSTGEKRPISEDDSAAAAAVADEDELVEAVEDQMLTERAVFGWDIVVWDGKPTSNEHANDGEGRGISDSEHDAAKRNAYGERTGIPRVREMLHETVNWSAPAQNHNNSHNRSRGKVPSADADADVDFLSSSNDDDVAFDDGLFVGPYPKSAGDEGEGEGEEMQVEQLQGLLEEAMAIREIGAEMPRRERERYAKRMVTSLLREP